MEEINLNQPVTSSNGSKGSLIGTIIVVIVLIVGAIYLLASSRTEAPIVPANEENTAATENIIIDETGTADLEADAANIDLSGLDTSTNDLDAAVNQ